MARNKCDMWANKATPVELWVTSFYEHYLLRTQYSLLTIFILATKHVAAAVHLSIVMNHGCFLSEKGHRKALERA